MRIVVTGGAGFIGSNFVRYLRGARPEWDILNLDKLTYAGNLENLRDLEGDDRHRFVKGDVASRPDVEAVVEAGTDAVINFAAESHVDRSIHDASEFIRTNIQGTQTLLDVFRERGVGRFLQVSTDEVYGSLGPDGRFTEETPIQPNSPYSASKAAADLLVRAAFHTHGTDAVITRCSNNYGPYQFPEKLLPLMISNALENKTLPVYGDGRNVRDWIFVEDHCEALLRVLEKGRAGEVYNIGAENEQANIDIVRMVLRKLDRPESLIRFVADRPGHDRRYAIDNRKVHSELGWSPRVGFEEGIERTVRWYVENRSWWEKIRTGEYLRYYEKHYGAEL
jgi:dTDP-glucose 4,6-dehydratase